MAPTLLPELHLLKRVNPSPVLCSTQTRWEERPNSVNALSSVGEGEGPTLLGTVSRPQQRNTTSEVSQNNSFRQLLWFVFVLAFIYTPATSYNFVFFNILMSSASSLNLHRISPTIDLMFPLDRSCQEMEFCTSNFGPVSCPTKMTLRAGRASWPRPSTTWTLESGLLR